MELITKERSDDVSELLGQNTTSTVAVRTHLRKGPI